MGKAYVYILGNKGGMLNVGVTNDVERRMAEHRNKLIEGYTKKFAISKLLYFEEFNHPVDAIGAEKMIKGWLRKKKMDLIRETNPKFEDLSKDWLLEE